MFNTSLRIVQHREEAEDVIQESFVTAFTRIKDFRGEATFGAWLKRIVINTSLKSIRGRIHFEQVEDQAHEVDEVETVEPHWTVKDVQRAMFQLPDGFRTVFTLYLLEGWSHQDIATHLGISVGTSKSQLNRAKKKVRVILETMEHEEGRMG